ncbi:MAG: phosphoribosylaminoimidazolesuccinocarboxamide synthase [Bacteroidetes bacterium]|nr:phosphoribosylaminoimidazolesuccinocarboxamide synthase [Bacteroidota bacterium]
MSTSFLEPVVLETHFTQLKLKNRGKVRDIYDLEDSLLIVATDRISAFDVVLSDGIPYKGKVLTKISDFWFEQTKDIIPNHLLSSIIYDFPLVCKPYWSTMDDRTMWVKKAQPLPVECIVRGYISGSAWSEYKKNKSVCGIPLPDGLVESAKLGTPIFTPTTKASVGHDENITFSQFAHLIGEKLAEQVREVSIALYLRGSSIAEEKGIIIADTKFEFGLDENGSLILIDEVLTPDSSRFWPKDKYEPGKSQESFDKQYVRDYLLSINFNKKPPAPKLPDEVIFKTSALYLEALKRLTGKELV